MVAILRIKKEIWAVKGMHSGRIRCGSITAVKICSFVCLFLGAALLSAQQSDLALKVCNKTGFEIVVAIGYAEYDPLSYVSKGWWRIPGGYCRDVLSGELPKERYYHYFAETTEGPHKLWQGKSKNSLDFCVSQHSFEIVGRQSCEERGYQRKYFRSIGDLSRVSKPYTLNLTD